MNKTVYNAGSGVKFNPMQGLGNNEVTLYWVFFCLFRWYWGEKIPVSKNSFDFIKKKFQLLAFLDSLQSTLRSSGFNEMAVSEIMQAMQVLAKYNIMGLGLGLGVAAMAQMRTQDMPSQIQMAPPQPQRFDLTQGMISSQNSTGLSSILDNPADTVYNFSTHHKKEVNIEWFFCNLGLNANYERSYHKTIWQMWFKSKCLKIHFSSLSLKMDEETKTLAYRWEGVFSNMSFLLVSNFSTFFKTWSKVYLKKSFKNVFVFIHFPLI